MIAKFAFFLIVALFGALMFAAGTLAPESVRQKVASLAQDAATRVEKPSAAKTKAEGEAPAAQPATPSVEKNKPTPFKDLLLPPAPPPEKGPYALQAGQFANTEAGDNLSKRIKDLGLPTVVIATVDSHGQKWSVVSAGAFNSADDARAAQASIAGKLGLTGPLPVIVLPAKPKS